MNSRRLPGAPAGSEQDAPDDYRPTDAELGVGDPLDDLAAEASGNAAPQSADAEAEAVAAALQNPAIARLIEGLVEKRALELAAANARLPEMPAPGAMSASEFMMGMRELGKTIAAEMSRATQATAEQLPGHVKIVAPEIIEKRAAAYAEMMALCRETAERFVRLQDEGDLIEAEKAQPTYLLAEDFPAPGEVGIVTYEQGDTIFWFGPPGFHMRPQNAIAKKIWDAMATYSGGAPQTASQIAVEAQKMRRPTLPGSAAIPELPPLLSTRGPTSRFMIGGVVDGNEKQEMGAKNIVGSVGQVTITKGPFNKPRNITQGEAA